MAASMNTIYIWVGAGLQACSSIKNKLYHKGFPVNIANILRAPCLKNISEGLLLYALVLIAKFYT